MLEVYHQTSKVSRTLTKKASNPYLPSLLYIPTVIKLKTIQFLWNVWMFECLNVWMPVNKCLNMSTSVKHFVDDYMTIHNHLFYYKFFCVFIEIDLFLIYIIKSIYDTIVCCYLTTTLFWPTVRRKCSRDWEKLLKFKAEERICKHFEITTTIYSNSERSENNFW